MNALDQIHALSQGYKIIRKDYDSATRTYSILQKCSILGKWERVYWSMSRDNRDREFAYALHNHPGYIEF